MRPHYYSMLKALCLLVCLLLCRVVVAQQGDFADIQDRHIYYLMKRTDLTLDEIEERASRYFENKGKGRGSGYKQYQRWLYEMKFHVDENRRIITPEEESRAFERFTKSLPAGSRAIGGVWTEMGPTTHYNTSGWNPGIGRVTSIAVHPSNTSVIYVSSPGGGIWKSTNGGSSWTPLLDYVDPAWMEIKHLQIDPNNPGTIYAGVVWGGVIKSTNEGASWSGTGSGPFDVRKVIVHPTNSNIILATAWNGIWRSVNGGTSWTQVNADEAEDIEFKPGDPNIVYVSANSCTIRRSVNNGISWTYLGSDQGITHCGRTLLAVSPNNPNVVYAVQSDPSLVMFGRLYKSTDSGLNYTTTVIGNPADGTNYFSYSETGSDSSGQAWYDMAIAVNPGNAEEVHIAGIATWKSTNGGYNFSPTSVWYYPNNIGYNHADVHALEFVGSLLFVGTDGGIYKSTNNGASWTDLSAGLGIRQIYRISHARTDPSRICIGAQDNGTSYRQADGTWLDWLGADGMDNLISPTDPNIIYGTWQFGGLNYSSDGGLTRDYIPEPSEGNWVTPLAMHPSNHNIIYGGWTGIYKSENGGTTWTNISGSYITQKLNTLTVAPSNTNYIYASVNNTLYVTGSGGASWVSRTYPAEITAVFVSIIDPTKIWITLNASENQVLVSNDRGLTYTSIASGLPALAARTVVVDEFDNEGDGVYVGMNVGVYYRTNTNPSWMPFGTSLPLVAINELEIHQSARKIRVATFGRGVWETDLNAVNGCASIVLNTADAGLGSLRAAIECLTGKDTILFHPDVNNSYINLTSGPVQIARNVVLIPNALQQIRIRSLDTSSAFHVHAGKQAQFANMQLYGGNTSSGSVFFNEGQLTLRNMTLYPHTSLPGSILIYNASGGMLTSENVVQMKRQQ